MSIRKDTDIEIDIELRKYLLLNLQTTQFNHLVIDCISDNKVIFKNWMKYPVNNNFAIFNMILKIDSSDPIFKLEDNPIKTIPINTNIIPMLIFEYLSHCDKNGVLI